MRHLDLFAGIGGFSLAAQWMGWETVAQVEWDEWCQKVLAKNFPDIKRYGDVREFKATKYRGAVDIISGGFPCQDVSNAKTWTTHGKYEGSGVAGKRSGLWYEYARIIDESKPSYAVAENVSELTNKGLDQVLQTLSEIGYDAEWAVIPSSIVGAPHLRKRIWIVAYPKCIGRGEESIIFSRIFSQEIQRSSQWEFSRTICHDNGKKALPESFGIHDGVPRRLYDAERIKGIGNAIVPQVAYEIFKAIESHSRRELYDRTRSQDN